MMGLQGGINFKVFEQFATGTGILGQNHIDFLEQLHGPEGHIPKIPNRGRNKVKFSHGSKVNPSHEKQQKGISKTASRSSRAIRPRTLPSVPKCCILA